MATITDDDLKMFQERAKTEFASRCDTGGIAWDSVIWDLSNEVRRLRSVSKERGDFAKLRKAIEDLFAKGCVSRHDRVAVCPPCIDNEGYSPSNEWCARCSSDVKEKCMAIYNACAALAAPPRNCDKYANYKDAMKAFEAFVRERGKLGFINPYTEAFKWLFAHATETEGGNDGRQ